MSLFGALLVPAALAESDTSDVTVNSGSLEMDVLDSISNFPNVTIGSTAQTTTTTMQDFNVRDFRGTGDGWNWSAQASQFTEHDGTAYVTSGATLPQSSLDLNEPTVSAVGDTTSPPPTTATGPYTIDSGTAVSVASAAVDEGMGEYNFAFGADSLALTVPVDAEAVTYRSDLTISLTTGP